MEKGEESTQVGGPTFPCRIGGKWDKATYFSRGRESLMRGGREKDVSPDKVTDVEMGGGGERKERNSQNMSLLAGRIVQKVGWANIEGSRK